MAISARQQRIRSLIPRDGSGRPPNERMRQLFDMLTTSVIDDRILDFVEREVESYLPIWRRRGWYLNGSASREAAIQGGAARNPQLPCA